MAWTLAGISLGSPQTCIESWVSKCDITPYPDAGSNNTYVYDTNGVLRTINIEGYYSAATAALVATWVSSMKALETGMQYASSALVFSNGFTSEATNVCLETFTYTYDINFVCMVKYSLTMYERVNIGE